MLNPISIGYLLLALAQASFAVTVVSCKYLFESMPMFLVTGGRFLISTIMLFIIFKMRKGTFHAPSHPEGRLTKKDWTLLILQGVLIAFLFNMLFAWGLQYASATSAGIISSTLPAIIALSAVWLLKERLNTAQDRTSKRTFFSGVGHCGSEL